jgi:hypothetical protein
MASDQNASASAHGDLLEMSVANMSFLIDRLYEDCSPLQFLRELTRNSIESIQRSGDDSGEIRWDIDLNRLLLTEGQVFKLCIVDTGVGMTGEEMVRYINQLSSSIHKQSKTGNFGVGAKISAAPSNKRGLVYLSWVDGVGYMIHLMLHPNGKYDGRAARERRLREYDGAATERAHAAEVDSPIFELPVLPVSEGCNREDSRRLGFAEGRQAQLPADRDRDAELVGEFQ